MKYRLLLAWRYIVYTRLRSAILVACVALTFLLPFSIAGLVGDYSESLVRRSRATPLIAGALGSRYDLVLSSLYFAGRVPRKLSMREAEELTATDFAQVIPIVFGQTAREYPLIGTTPDYFARRGLRLQSGSIPLLLGEAAIGSTVSEELGLGVGDSILTDEGSLYDLSLRSPLKLVITGVFREARSSDDGAIFADVKSVWISMGIGHGHVDAESEQGSRVLGTVAGDEQNPDRIVLGAATYEYTEITPDNIDSFHFHGEPADYPLTAILLFPRDDRSATILKGRYRISEELQLLEPIEVVEELMGLVFKVKSFFDANSVLVSVSTALFLVLVLLLSVRVRRREIETLSKIGCARTTVFQIFGLELGLLVATGLALSLGLSLLIEQLLQQLISG